MRYFLIRYDSRVVIYDRRAFIRLATDNLIDAQWRCLPSFGLAQLLSPGESNTGREIKK